MMHGNTKIKNNSNLPIKWQGLKCRNIYFKIQLKLPTARPQTTESYSIARRFRLTQVLGFGSSGLKSFPLIQVFFMLQFRFSLCVCV